jgi:hypothetical protein
MAKKNAHGSQAMRRHKQQSRKNNIRLTQIEQTLSPENLAVLQQVQQNIQRNSLWQYASKD